jgi:TolB-like protein
MSGDPEQEYFSDGITEDIITELSRFRSLFVIARNSSFVYKGRSAKTQDIGRELGVAYIVEGSVRKAANRVRVTAQLVEAETGNHLWAQRYDRELADIFMVQDEVVQAIATAVPGQLEDVATDRARRKPSESLTAYDYLLRGEQLQLRSYGVAEALPLYEKAIEIDPRCARAYSRLAAYHGYSVFAHGASIEEARCLAQSFAEKALASDPADSLVQVIAAQAYQMIGNHDLTRRHIERAIALNPNDLVVVRFAGQILAYLGEHGDALKWLGRYLRLDPYFADGVRETLFDTYYMARRHEDAITSFRGWANPPPHMSCELAAACAQLGRMEDAQVAVAEFERAKPAGYDFAAVSKAHARMCARREDAEHWLEGYRKAGLLA